MSCSKRLKKIISVNSQKPLMGQREFTADRPIEVDENCNRCRKLEVENSKLRALNMRLQNQLLAKQEGKKLVGGFFF